MLPPNVSINIQLNRTPDNIILVSPSAEGKSYRLEIEDIKLEYVRVRLMEPLVSRLFETWRTHGSLDFYFHRVLAVGPYDVKPNTRVMNETVAVSQLPIGVMAVFVSSQSSVGSFERNLFKFYQ